MTHTNARWVGRSCHVETDRGDLIADVYAPGSTHETRTANRDLIAAAPDMLSALLGLLSDPYLSDPINAGRMEAARAAVGRATGYAGPVPVSSA
jgi:hypothetical protein